MKTMNPSAAHRLSLLVETAAELMTNNPVSLRAQATVDEARALFIGKKIGAAPVIDEAGHPIGVLSHSDIIIHDAVRPIDPSGVEVDFNNGGAAVATASLMAVEDLMTPAVFAVAADTSAVEVVKSMVEYGIHHVFVVDAQGVLIGVISTLDVLRHLRA